MVTWLYVRGYDGWGAWAAAPLLLPSFLASAIWGCAGLALLAGAVARTRELDVPLLAATLFSGAVAAYYLLRAWT